MILKTHSIPILRSSCSPTIQGDRMTRGGVREGFVCFEVALCTLRVRFLPRRFAIHQRKGDEPQNQSELFGFLLVL
ncbi:hypothetical protein CDAR_394861 [Caerostris darwini]|uniref:Uncharacterized protein n=1 Tax=Caerostris darwini TaxID=1538125 RepID=A0AAV4RM89_9ARAC|nr:hypothetical protein CDAR_394861 [Caerostris darwini]